MFSFFIQGKEPDLVVLCFFVSFFARCYDPLHSFFTGLFGRNTLAHELDNGMASCDADHFLAVPGGGSGSNFIIHVKTRANYRRITDPAMHLISETAGCARSRQVALR